MLKKALHFISPYLPGSVMRKIRVVMKETANGDLHLILPDKTPKADNNIEELGEDEIRRIMKEEASKPLLILRM